MFDLLNTQASRGQIKLHKLSVFNWGVFDGLNEALIHENGTSISGDNGGGKTTLLDALKVVFSTPSRASFNLAAAQGDNSDRTLMGYIRSSHGSIDDGVGKRSKYKRDKGVVSAVQAVLKSENQQFISLIAMFWINGSSTENKDVQRLYMISHQNVSLSAIISEYDQNKNNFKGWLAKNGIKYTSVFDEYEELYRRELQMPKNAPALLSRAVGLKNISNLPELIRTLVLEPSDIKERAKEVVGEFADLDTIYKQSQDYNEQEKHLAPLVDFDKTIRRTEADIEKLKAVQSVTPAYFAKMQSNEYRRQLADIERQLSVIKQQIEQKTQEIQSCESNIDTYQQQYLQLGGGELQLLEKEIKSLQAEYDRKNKIAVEYQTLCRQLGLTDELEYEAYQNRITVCGSHIEQLGIEKEKLQQDSYGVNNKLYEVQNRIQDIKSEIDVIEKARSNIAAPFQKVRSQMCHDLSLLDDDIPYIGELLDVADDEKPWQGAIERALGGLTSTLVVSQDNYKAVTAWLNKTHTGLHIRVQVVNEGIDGNEEALDDGFVGKLVFKPHAFSNWLKKFLVRHDLTCVSNVDKAQMLPYSMTIEGLIQRQKGRFEKNDKKRISDKQFWQLGFSNETRLRSLQEELKEYQVNKQALDEEFDKLNKRLKNTAVMVQAYERLMTVNWTEIDVISCANLLSEKQAVLERLNQSAGQLQQIELLLKQEKAKKEDLTKNWLEMSKTQGSLEFKQQDIGFALESVAQQASVEIDLAITTQLDELCRKHVGEGRTAIVISQACLDELNQNLESLKKKLNDTTNKVIRLMSQFSGTEKWRALTTEWTNDLASLPDYLAYYQHLTENKLGKQEMHAQKKLVDNCLGSLATLIQASQDEKSDIKQKIEKINSVLQKTAFRDSSYLRLKAKDEKYPINDDFNRLVRKAKELYRGGASLDQLYVTLNKLMDMLRKASDSATANNQESLRLLDPRYQLTFVAEEVGFDGVVRDELNSSSGKSGGEKESFAGIILAASLAYVLTPEGADKPVFCTVFLDEAFSQTQDTNAMRVLKVFKDLGLHVNLISPPDKVLNFTNGAGGLVHVTKDAEKHVSHLQNISWRQYQEQNKNKLGFFNVKS